MEIVSDQPDPVTGQGGPPGAVGTSTVWTVRLPGIRVDDWVFGVSSVAADGSESPVASAVPGGAFRPVAPPSQP
jgi:hypothetical protein